MLDYVQPVVNNEMNAHLTGPVMLNAVKNAVFQMGGMKAPGPNGSREFSTILTGT